METPESSPVDFSMITIQELPRRDNSRVPSRLFKAGAIGLCATALVYGVRELPETTNPNATDVTNEAGVIPPDTQGSLPETINNTCQYPQASDIAAVESLFAQAPQTFKFPANWDPTLPEKYTTFYYKTVPSQFGLTMHNADELYALNLYSEKSPSFAKVLHETQAFMKLYGVDLQVMTKKEAVKHDGLKSAVPTKNELQSLEAKAAVLSLAEGISEVPEEFVRQVGLKHIWLVTKGDGFAGYAEISGAHDTIVDSIDQNQGMGSELFTHEFEHLTEPVLCGNDTAAANDPAYEALNGVIPYDDEMGDMTPRQALRQRPYSFKEVEVLSRGYINTPNTLMPCDVAENFEQQMKVYSQYAYTNVIEDKAELGKNLFNRYSYRILLDKRFPILRQKAMILLARMYQKSPNVVRYLAAVSERPDVTDPFCEPTAK